MSHLMPDLRWLRYASLQTQIRQVLYCQSNAQIKVHEILKFISGSLAFDFPLQPGKASIELCALTADVTGLLHCLL